MEFNVLIGFICCGVVCFAWGQMEAAGNIGNRAYAVWYRTHFLVEKRGICKVIYFRPKHFERYTLYEVLSFFASYLYVLVFAAVGLLFYLGVVPREAIFVTVGVAVFLQFFSAFAIVLVNDIGSRRDEKKKFYLASGEREILPPLPDSFLEGQSKLAVQVMQMAIDCRNQPYFTVHNLWDSYHARLHEAGTDLQKRDRVNLAYIAYFQNIPYLTVIKENKNGSLQLRIDK